MDLSALRQRRESNRIQRRRRGAVVALASGLVVLLLVMGVFSVASLSRSVAQDSSRVHAMDETLKSITIIRAQLGFGIVLSDLDRTTAIDASTAVDAAAADVASSTVDLATSVAFISENLEGLDSETQAAITAFTASVEQIQLEDPAAQPTIDAITTFERSYEEATRLVAFERDQALDAVAEADGDLSRLGTLVNFLVAFVVPTVAFGIYRALTKPETELLTTDAQLIKDTVLRVLRRDLLVREIDELEAVVAELPTPEHLGQSPKDRVAALRRTVLTLDKAHQTSFSNVSLRAALDNIARRADASSVTGDNTVTISCDAYIEVWSDPDALDVLLTAIVADCQNAGATRISFTVSQQDDTATVRIVKNGMVRTHSELQLLSKQGTVADRIALLGGSDTAVVSALHFAEDLGGTLDLVDVGEQQSFVLELPMPTTASSPTRALIFGEA